LGSSLILAILWRSPILGGEPDQFGRQTPVECDAGEHLIAEALKPASDCGRLGTKTKAVSAVFAHTNRTPVIG